jgi:hypothetical protein
MARRHDISSDNGRTLPNVTPVRRTIRGADALSNDYVEFQMAQGMDGETLERNSTAAYEATQTRAVSHRTDCCSNALRYRAITIWTAA